MSVSVKTLGNSRADDPHVLDTLELTIIGFRRPFRLTATLWTSRRIMHRRLSWVRGQPFEALCSTYPDDRGSELGELHFYHGKILTPGIIAHEVTHATFALGKRLGWDLTGYEPRSSCHEEYHCLRVHKLTDIICTAWSKWVGHPPVRRPRA